MNTRTCEECRAIARELTDAYSDAWLSAEPEFREAWLATYQMIGGTEADAARVEELRPRTHPQAQYKVGRALSRKFRHESVTGHKVQARASS